MISAHEASETENDDLGMQDLVKLVKAAWVPAMVGGFLLAVTGFGLSFLFQSEYRAQVLLEYAGDPTKQERVRSGVGGLGGLAAIAGINLGSDGDPKDAALATLRSWNFARDFIEANKLAPLLNAKDWDESKKQWRDPANPPNEWRTIKRFRRDVLYVANDAKTGLISVSVEWKDPVVAADWATKLVSMINIRLRATAIEEATRSIDHLKTELAKTQNTELQRAIAGLLQTQIESLMFADIREEFAFRTIDAALAPPPDEYVFPNRLVFFLLGGVFGGLAGVTFRLLRRRPKGTERERAKT